MTRRNTGRELDEKRQALSAAEIVDRSKRRRSGARIAGALDATPPAYALGLWRGEIAEIERRIMDCRVAVAQLERALAPDEITMAA